METDTLSPGIMQPFHKFREKKLSFTYLCKKCLRSFDSTDELQGCRFCEGPIVELRSVMPEKTKTGPRNRYRYFCTTCEKHFTTTQKMTVCSNCRTDYLHVYKWGMLRKREKFYIMLHKSLDSLFTGMKEGRTKMQGIKLRDMKTSLGFAKQKEELPTY